MWWGFRMPRFSLGRDGSVGGPFLLTLRKTGMGVWDWDVSGGVAWRSPNRGADLHLCPALAPGADADPSVPPGWLRKSGLRTCQATSEGLPQGFSAPATLSGGWE